MDLPKKQNKGQRVDAVKFFAIFSFLFFAFIVFANIKLYINKKGLLAEISSSSKQIEEIKKNNEKLKEEIEKSDDKDYIEKVAREEANMQKPGEKAVSFIMPEKKEQAGQEKKGFFDFFVLGLRNFWQELKSVF